MPSVHSNGYVNGNPSAPPPPPQSMQHFGAGAPQGYAYQYSNCTGRRKALLIGINYFGQRGQLRGCINDVKNMSAFLYENFGYQQDDMVILTDDQQKLMSQPTKRNILRAMHWLVKDARPNDSLFFHYSGNFEPLQQGKGSLTLEVTAVKLRISMEIRRTNTMRSSIQSISAKSDTLSTTRCTKSWSSHYNLVCD
jgi:hypothetical protein